MLVDMQNLLMLREWKEAVNVAEFGAWLGMVGELSVSVIADVPEMNDGSQFKVC